MTSPDLPPEADATAEDHLVGPSDNGPEDGVEAPSQDPTWDPNAGVEL
jgi:hypothetical protein